MSAIPEWEDIRRRPPPKQNFRRRGFLSPRAHRWQGSVPPVRELATVALEARLRCPCHRRPPNRLPTPEFRRPIPSPKRLELQPALARGWYDPTACEPQLRRANFLHIAAAAVDDDTARAPLA